MNYGYTVRVPPSASVDGLGRFACEECGEVYDAPDAAGECCTEGGDA